MQQSNASMKKHDGKAVQANKKTFNYYCMSDISCLHHGDRLKTAVDCFYRTFIIIIVYWFYIFSHFEFELP